MSKAQTDNGKDNPDTTRELAKVAAEAGLDEISARAWLNLLNELTSHQISHDEARTLEAAAHAAIIRAGSPPRLVFQELFMGGVRAASAGEYQLARERMQASLPLAGNPQTRVEVESNLAKLTLSMDGPSAALPLAEKSLKDYEDVFGKDHNYVSDALIFLAQVQQQMRDLPRAKSDCRARPRHTGAHAPAGQLLHRGDVGAPRDRRGAHGRQRRRLRAPPASRRDLRKKAETSSAMQRR